MGSRALGSGGNVPSRRIRHRAKGGVVTEPQLDGMPEPDIMQTIRYVIERTSFVGESERFDVGDQIGLAGGGDLQFEIVKVTHTIKDRNDVYVSVASELQ